MTLTLTAHGNLAALPPAAHAPSSCVAYPVHPGLPLSQDKTVTTAAVAACATPTPASTPLFSLVRLPAPLRFIGALKSPCVPCRASLLSTHALQQSCPCRVLPATPTHASTPAIFSLLRATSHPCPLTHPSNPVCTMCYQPPILSTHTTPAIMSLLRAISHPCPLTHPMNPVCATCYQPPILSTHTHQQFGPCCVLPATPAPSRTPAILSVPRATSHPCPLTHSSNLAATQPQQTMWSC